MLDSDAMKNNMLLSFFIIFYDFRLALFGETKMKTICWEKKTVIMPPNSLWQNYYAVQTHLYNITQGEIK